MRIKNSRHEHLTGGISAREREREFYKLKDLKSFSQFEFLRIASI